MILCLGLYGSGSTWAFNAVRDVGRACNVPITSCYAETLAPILALPPGLAIIKAHHLDKAAASYVHQHATHIILTIRDPRDAALSLHERVYPKFPQALAMLAKSIAFAQTYATDPRCSLLRYEAGCIDNPNTLDLFATLFNQTLTTTQRDTLFTETRRAAIDAKIATLPTAPGDVYDPETQWHRHHATRPGTTGRWRDVLTTRQIAAVEKKCRRFMERFKY
jgi:hypothetical protein